MIFYKVGNQWWKEPTLNLVAAIAQMSKFTHVELAIGDAHAADGSMKNVARVFNDATGCVRVCDASNRRPPPHGMPV